MEYNTEEYQRGGGKPITTSDGYKYFSNRKKSDCVYLKCVLFRNGCKGSAKLNTQINLVYPKSLHNHEVDAYNSEVFALKSRCRTRAKSSRDNLRYLFNDTTRADPSAHKVTYKECESLMFRARRTSQPIIPKSAIEFCDLLPTTNFALNLKATITLSDRIAVIFFSEKIHIMIGDISDIQFDGTFYVVPRIFYQLFTIFISIGTHTLPAIHCLMTHKDEELYTEVILKIKDLFPQFQPTNIMSDWERGSRNSFKHVYPGTRINGCWFHYTQAIWRKIQKYGLTSCYRNNPELTIFVKKIMAIPHLPCDLIHSTYSLLQPPALQQIDQTKLDGFLRYFKRYWLTQVTPSELSVFELENVTNNGAESYHARLKCLFKTGHPRIWNFMHTLNDLITDYDNDISRLVLGREITRSRKKQVKINIEHRKECKEKLTSGVYTPWEFLASITHSLTQTITFNESVVYISDDSDESEGQEQGSVLENQNLCAVCLNVREVTWLFLPCKHANCCTQCSNTITELAQTCPTCRAPILDKFQIYLN